MNDHEPNSSALKREWLTARVVLIVGFTLAIAAGAYLGLAWRGKVEHARQQAAADIAKEDADSKANTALAEQGAAFCHAALANAQGMGIVPGFAKPADIAPKATKTTGRYLCAATTDSSVFTVAADLVCRDLKNPKCVSLYAVAQNGKTVLYKRQD